MTIILTELELEELYEQSPAPDSNHSTLDDFEELTSVPEVLGQGFHRTVDLLPGMQLTFSDYRYRQDVILNVPVHSHPIQTSIWLSGFIHGDVHPCLGETCCYFSGSGISPAYAETSRAGEQVALVDVEIEPAALESLFLDDRQRQSEPMQQLFKGEDWKVSFYPAATAKLRSLVQQMWNAPYQGSVRRLYLQAKVLELLAMQLDWLGVGQESPSAPTMVKVRDRVYDARAILLSDLEHPPSVVELAQQVGVGVSTLQRQFQALYGRTVFGYLTDQRMTQAEQLLRQGHYTIAEVAATVGYSNPAHFAAAFRRKFGITPRQCLLGQKGVSR